MSDIPFDPYKRELKFCADVMCAYLEGYSQVGYEELLKMCERVLPLDKMSHEKIAEIFDVPVANVEALASGMSVAEVMKTARSSRRRRSVECANLRSIARSLRIWGWGCFYEVCLSCRWVCDAAVPVDVEFSEASFTRGREEYSGVVVGGRRRHGRG